MRLLLNIAFYVQGLQTKELVLYIVLCSFLVCCGFFFFKHSLVHLQCLQFCRFRHSYFKSRFNAIIQKTIYISIYAVCELDIKDKKQM